MINIPGPADASDDDDIDTSPSGLAWRNEVGWAKLGQFKLLIDSLRAGKLIAAEDQEVREFLAEFLAGKIKRPEGKPPDYEDWTFGILDGEITIIKKNYAVICGAAAHVWNLRKTGKTIDQALDETFSEYRAVQYYGEDGRPLTKSEKRQLERFVKGSAKDRKRLAGVPTRK